MRKEVTEQTATLNLKLCGTIIEERVMLTGAMLCSGYKQNAAAEEDRAGFTQHRNLIPDASCQR